MALLRSESTFLVPENDSKKRNLMLESFSKDLLIHWMKEVLYHSFVLNAKDSYSYTMSFFEELIDEHRVDPQRSRLKQFVPTVGLFHTPLPLLKGFQIYDQKYCISKRCHVAPSFNEVRHILNISQVLAIGENLKFISFDGDQTLYTNGENFEENEELSTAIIQLLIHGVKVAVITAAGYGKNGSLYCVRLKGLLQKFIEKNLTKEQLNCFYVVGGECNYFFQCNRQEDFFNASSIVEKTNTVVDILVNNNNVNKNVNTNASQTSTTTTTQNKAIISTTTTTTATLTYIENDEWQASTFNGPKPHQWSREDVNELLDVAETSMRSTVDDLNLRARILRKERAVGVFPGLLLVFIVFYFAFVYLFFCYFFIFFYFCI
jgi:hypothetical protein